MDDGNRLTVYELVERVIPCIIAKHYSENYIQGFRSTFRNLLAYCNKNEKKYFTAELAQQFMLDCYGVQPGTVERRCSRVHRAMDLLSDYQHFNAVMLRRRLNREFPAGLQEGAVNYLQKLSLHGRRENTLRSHRNVLLRFTDYLFSVGVTDYKLLSADIVNRYLPFRKNCCKSGRKRDLTKTKPRNVFGFRMCEFFVSICTAMAMMLHVHSTLRLM